MSKVLRMVLTWMLAVALPLQGYAVHAMASCGPAHHRPAVDVAEASSDHHDGAAGGHHSTAVEQADAVDDVAASDTQSVQASKCSLCASCCSATAIAAASFSFDPVPVMPVTVATVPVAHERVLPGGLERPPKLLIA